ncbi:hypothetical protein M406DRAFT_46549 [Cryphonectria parasitica EP155]|uniref:Uncharacterized protein n=1 Tax=Cryphonectria parasitica (strain ATCC 38755 / EP155) TaxID=660469 RepID=A0A9P4XYF7_CRYP1|nr:uncharacterized protein M406DRAFT_46549 [Cryphonectria parasitica EP155]KAF3762840.1 hypothetical protein M406DRAFT_46549 [Cryphonectria parasitica EP155]
MFTSSDLNPWKVMVILEELSLLVRAVTDFTTFPIPSSSFMAHLTTLQGIHCLLLSFTIAKS